MKQSNNVVLRSISRSFLLLPHSYRKKAILLFIGILINSLLDLLGLAAILPLLAAILQEGFIFNNPVLSNLYSFGGFTDVRWFIVFLCVVILGFVTVKNGFGLWIHKKQLQFSWGAYENVSDQVLQSAYQNGYSYFKNNNSNFLLTRITSVPLGFSQMLLIQLFLFLNEFVILILVIISLALYDFKILLALGFIVAPVFFLFYRLSKKRLSFYHKRLNHLIPFVSKPVFEIVFGYVDVVVGNVFNTFRGKYLEVVSESKNLRIKSMLIGQIPNRLVEVCVIVAVIIMLLYGVFFLDSPSQITALLSVFALAAYRSIPSINRLMLSLVNIKGQEFNLDILEEFLPFDSKEKKLEVLEFKNEIELKNLTFKFDDQIKPLIDNFNLKISKGEVVGFVGKSGSGKTTLMNILLGFLKQTSGSVFIDNNELSSDNVNSWQQKIGYVRQDVFLIDGTVTDNIAFGVPKDQVDKQKLDEVIEKARLIELVEELSQGVDTNIGERGSNISGGQRQRIGIARALYGGAEVLFFDEATSALDTETESEITEAIRELHHSGLTMLIIAHRESTLKYCDKIIDLSQNL